MSSPMMTRMLGFLDCARASVAASRRHDITRAAIATHRTQRFVDFALFMVLPFDFGFIPNDPRKRARPSSSQSLHIFDGAYAKGAVEFERRGIEIILRHG